MRILATGAAGMLGTSLVPSLVRAGHEVVATDIDLSDPRPWGLAGPPLEALDVRDRAEVGAAVASTAPDLLLHLAAETSLERSDEDPDHAYLTNTIATKYVALAARRYGIPLTYISTAGVFDGEKDGPYTEFDTPHPLNTYGASKYEGELVVRDLVDEYYIVRAGWMVGGGATKDHKFVSRIVDQLRSGIDTVYAVTDKLGTPTYAPDFARCFGALIDSGVYGLYHMACSGSGSRYDVAAHILRVLDRDDVRLVPVTSEHFAEEFPSVRPPSEIMRNLALELQGMNTMRPWQVALEEYLLTEFGDLAAPSAGRVQPQAARSGSHGCARAVPVPDPADQPRQAADTRSVCVVIPIPSDPPWELFDEIPDDIPIIVSDDSDGRLAPPPRRNVYVYDYAAQRAYAGAHYDAMPHKSAASRNIGHYIAYREGFDVIVALDFDCRTRPGWLADHLAALTKGVDVPALQPTVERGWVNSVEQRFEDGSAVYARGYPYELRTPALSATAETVTTGEVKVNMGVWDGVLDLNGVDKLFGGEPGDPGLRTGPNRVALGNIPVCGMNTAFAAEVTPAYYFLPDVWVDGWQLSRHDDIWGGYILKRLMDLRGDLFTFGAPVVEHTKQTRLERVVVLEQWMHLLSMPFYDIVETALTDVAMADYGPMYAHFVEEFQRVTARSSCPPHYRVVFAELGEWMSRWAKAFS